MPKVVYITAIVVFCSEYSVFASDGFVNIEDIRQQQRLEQLQKQLQDEQVHFSHKKDIERLSTT